MYLCPSIRHQSHPRLCQPSYTRIIPSYNTPQCWVYCYYPSLQRSSYFMTLVTYLRICINMAPVPILVITRSPAAIEIPIPIMKSVIVFLACVACAVASAAIIAEHYDADKPLNGKYACNRPFYLNIIIILSSY